VGHDEQAHITVTLPTALGPSRLELQVDERPMRLSELAALGAQLTDIVVERALENEQRDGRSISCGAGCAACCHHLVGVSLPEAFLVADVVSDLEPALQAKAIASFDRAALALQSAELLEALRRLASTGPAERRAVAERYAAAAIGCPLLIDGRCSIYPSRPLICRDLNVTSPRECCSGVSPEAYRRVPTGPLLSGPLARLTAKLAQGAPPMVAMPLVLEAAEAHAELAFHGWPAHGLVAALLAEIEAVAAIPTPRSC
jgi:Fe-S-cluster containining protein